MQKKMTHSLAVISFYVLVKSMIFRRNCLHSEVFVKYRQKQASVVFVVFF